jgi:hypothetical protein
LLIEDKEFSNSLFTGLAQIRDLPTESQVIERSFDEHLSRAMSLHLPLQDQVLEAIPTSTISLVHRRIKQLQLFSKLLDDFTIRTCEFCKESPLNSKFHEVVLGSDFASLSQGENRNTCDRC